MTKIILKASLAVGIFLGLVFFSRHLLEFKAEKGSGESRTMDYLETPESKTSPRMPVDSVPVISVSSDLFPGNEGLSPKYLFQEGRTIWHARVPPQYPEWVEIAFPRPVLVTHLGIRAQGDSPGRREHGRGPKDFIFQGSNDASEPTGISKNRKWIDLLNVKGNAYTRGEEWKDWSFENKTAFRYFRIYIKAGGDRDYLTIRQIRFDREVKIPEPVAAAVVTPVQSTDESLAERDKFFGVQPIAIPGSIPQEYLASPVIDPVSLRKKFDDAEKRAGAKTKEEAMRLNLVLWENRRKTYGS